MDAIFLVLDTRLFAKATALALDVIASLRGNLADYRRYLMGDISSTASFPRDATSIFTQRFG